MSDEVLESVRRSTLLIVGLTVFDKILALGKEMLFAFRFGVSPELDVFNVAYAFPAILSMLLCQAVVSTLVPLYHSWQTQSPRLLSRSVATIAWVSLCGFIILAITCYAFAPTVFNLMGFGFPVEHRPLGAQIEYMLVWLILIDGATAVLAGILNAQKTFTALYLSQLFINGAIIFFMAFIPHLGIFGVSYGFILGSFLKFITLAIVLGPELPFLKRVTPLEVPALKEFSNLLWPLVVGGLVVNANILVDQVMSTELPAGSVSALRYAYRINDLPVQLFVIAAARALFPYISEQMVADDQDGMREVFWRGVLFIVTVSLPVTCFVFLFSSDIVDILLQRGAFDEHAAGSTSRTLTYYSLGMIFYAYSFLNGIFFTAMRRAKTLLVMGVATMIANVFFNWLFIKIFQGPEGVALSTTVTTGLTCVCFAFIIERNLSVAKQLPRLKPFLLVVFLCALAAGGVMAARTGLPFLELSTYWRFGLLACVFGVIYLGGLFRLCEEELYWCLGMLLPAQVLHRLCKYQTPQTD